MSALEYSRLETMPEELVTIAHEFSPLKANLMRTRLEADGIECFLGGEALTGVVGSLSYASASWKHPEGNIAVQVRASDAITAKAILQEIESAPNEDEESENFVADKPHFALQLLRGIIIGWLAFSITLFVGGATQNWLLGVLAGVVAFVGMSFFAFKKSFKSKR